VELKKKSLPGVKNNISIVIYVCLEQGNLLSQRAPFFFCLQHSARGPHHKRSVKRVLSRSLAFAAKTTHPPLLMLPASAFVVKATAVVKAADCLPLLKPSVFSETARLC
jgi:hypothetical protein